MESEAKRKGVTILSVSCIRELLMVTICLAPTRPTSVILVAGATGAVGKLVVKNLLRDGFHVRAVVRSKTTSASVLGFLRKICD